MIKIVAALLTTTIACSFFVAFTGIWVELIRDELTRLGRLVVGALWFALAAALCIASLYPALRGYYEL